MTTPKDLTITLPLRQFVHLALGRGYWSDRPIPQEVAELILAITNNKPEVAGCYVETVDEWSKHLEEPILWNYSFWVDAHERRLRQKRYSDNERSKRFIEEANVKLVSQALRRELSLEGDVANVTAHSLVTKHRLSAIKALGISKLFETIEEIP